MKKSFLFGRKRIQDLAGEVVESQSKKEQLLALKLQDLNDDAKATGQLLDLSIELVQSDPTQPRKRFRYLEGLAASIQEKGIIQPIIVAHRNQAGMYTIIAGERRFRAAKLAGLHTIPCIVRDESDTSTVILQLLENDQRDGVSPMEESNALVRLIDEMGVTKSQLAKELGRDPAWVSIRLGLQKASDQVRKLVNEGIVEDARTLHELRKLDNEDPRAASVLIDKIRTNQLSGSYRDIIAEAREKRKAKRGAKQRIRKLQKIEVVDNQILLYVSGNTHPLQFELTPGVLAPLLSGQQSVANVA